MPIFSYDCASCKRTVKIFSHKEQVCPKCGSNSLKRVLSVPLKNRNLEGTRTNYRGVEYLEGIKEDVKTRNKKNFKETIKETIDKFGIKIAIEQGWCDENGKIKDEWEDK